MDWLLDSAFAALHKVVYCSSLVRCLGALTNLRLFDASLAEGLLGALVGAGLLLPATRERVSVCHHESHDFPLKDVPSADTQEA